MCQGDDGTMPTVIFIASESRSGSTVLDLILGDQEGCVSVGEMRRLQGFALQSHKIAGFLDESYPLTCSCGRYIDDCDFWQKVEKFSGFSLGNTSFKSQSNWPWGRLTQGLYLMFGERTVRYLSHWLPGIKKELEVAYNCLRVYEAISQLTGASYIVDSSKQIYHYILLKIACSERVKLVVLYRDGRAVAFSQVRGKRAALWPRGTESPYAQAARHWAKVNRAIRLFSLRTSSSDQVVVRYEDVCTDPTWKVGVICSHFGIRAPETITSINKQGKHIIGGSPSRFDTSRSAIELDEKWKSVVTARDLIDFEGIGGKLNRQLGYK